MNLESHVILDNHNKPVFECLYQLSNSISDFYLPESFQQRKPNFEWPFKRGVDIEREEGEKGYM